MVIDTDGSAFITKAEFDSLKNNFQAQIDNYNSSIDSKIDGAIASYLSGIKVIRLSIRNIELSDKLKVLSIGTTNAPRYEYSEAMTQFKNGGVLIINADTQSQERRRRQIITKEFDIKGNSEQWNNPKQKKVAIRNVNATNAEFVDYYQKCAEKITLGMNPYHEQGSNPITTVNSGDFYVNWSEYSGLDQQDKNWDLTSNPGWQAYGCRVSDASTGQLQSDSFAFGWLSISSAETKWTDPCDYYINVFKPVNHRCWSNYEYNCSWPGNSYASSYDQYVRDLMLLLQPGKTGHTDGVYLDDDEFKKWNERWKNATVEPGQSNSVTVTNVQYYAPGSNYNFFQGTREIKGAAAYVDNSAGVTRGGLFCLAWDPRVSNWNQLWYAGYNKYVDFYDAKTYTGKDNTLATGKDGKKHLFLAAGFPLLSVKKNETVKYNFKIQESGNYDLWIKNLPFTSDQAWSETGLIAAKNTSTGAAATTKVALVGGGVNNNVEFLVPEDGYIWIKWAKHEATASNYDGLGTLLLESEALITEPED